MGIALFVVYDPLFEEYGFVRPEVLVEFGARSTGEPHGRRHVVCDAAARLPEISFPAPHVRPSCWPSVLGEGDGHARILPAGTPPGRSRHWHDVVRLDDAGIAGLALADRALARSVARHKAMFFAEKDTTGAWIDYEAAVSESHWSPMEPLGRAR